MGRHIHTTLPRATLAERRSNERRMREREKRTRLQVEIAAELERVDRLREALLEHGVRLKAPRRLK
jgi:hypothetical protein